MDMIREEGNLFLEIKKEKKDPLRVIKKVLDTLGIDYSSFPKFNGSKGEKDSTVTVTVPGILFRTKKNTPIFLTPLELKDDIKHFLKEKEVEVVRY